MISAAAPSGTDRMTIRITMDSSTKIPARDAPDWAIIVLASACGPAAASA